MRDTLLGSHPTVDDRGSWGRVVSTSWACWLKMRVRRDMPENRGKNDKCSHSYKLPLRAPSGCDWFQNLGSVGGCRKVEKRGTKLLIETEGKIISCKYFEDVSREFDEFRVNAHLCKLRCWHL